MIESVSVIDTHCQDRHWKCIYMLPMKTSTYYTNTVPYMHMNLLFLRVRNFLHYASYFHVESKHTSCTVHVIYKMSNLRGGGCVLNTSKKGYTHHL